jgi:hypothetical protein
MRGKCCLIRHGAEPTNSGWLVEPQKEAHEISFVPSPQGRNRTAEQLFAKLHWLLATARHAVLEDWSVWLLKVLWMG